MVQIGMEECGRDEAIILFEGENIRRRKDEFLGESGVTETHERTKRRQHDDKDSADRGGLVHGVGMFRTDSSRGEKSGQQFSGELGIRNEELPSPLPAPAAPALEEEIPAGLFTLMGPAAYFLKYNSSIFQVT
ncbi:MAG TPA: hypothetical protein VKV04_06530 [Verrucomicrobiae bacterium]|nr:hypothetical protein [Verrucomicrobiae bacterium]